MGKKKMPQNLKKGPEPRKDIANIAPYVPGKPIEELTRQYGIAKPVKLASNENPLGPPPIALEAIQKALSSLHRYPDGAARILVAKLAQKLGVEDGCVILGNGSDEIIQVLALAYLNPGDEAVMSDPSFLMYEISVRTAGGVPVKIPLKNMTWDMDATLAAIGQRTRIVFVNNPNNPTGASISKAEFSAFLQQIPSHVIVCVDEAYIDFVRDKNCAIGTDYLKSDNNTVAVLRTFSKIYGMAGLRLGYGIMPQEICGILNRIRLPFNANSLAQAAATAVLDDDGFVAKTRKTVHEGLDYLYGQMEQMGLDFVPSQANYFLVKMPVSADEVFEALLQKGVIVRSMRAYGYPDHIRVSAGLFEENQRFVDALKAVLA
ncbi:MAG: histidinol-phosphate transaminase [Desulfatibacillaceae bacterium]|nr:histidinol-phosphate transaminase [Desulfatibacillaceae bacterium]